MFFLSFFDLFKSLPRLILRIPRPRGRLGDVPEPLTGSGDAQDQSGERFEKTKHF